MTAHRPPHPIARTATLDPTGRFRYALSREWNEGSGRIAFVMLNPSTADHHRDDPTIRRCTAFAQRWGFAALDVVNLFALRATDPRELADAPDPFGPDNASTLQTVINAADEAVLAWGTSIRFATSIESDRALAALAAAADTRHLSCLGMTKHAHPRHPLFVRAETDRSSCTLVPAHENGAARSDRPIKIKLLD